MILSFIMLCILCSCNVCIYADGILENILLVNLIIGLYSFIMLRHYGTPIHCGVNDILLSRVPSHTNCVYVMFSLKWF